MADTVFSGPNYSLATKKNILHAYRSWNYNFVLGAVPPNMIGSEADAIKSASKYCVLNSAGKGSTSMQVDSSAAPTTADLVKEYNVNSPGHFNLYIDDVEIDSLISAGSTPTGLSQSTNLKFTVVEPYSINGFIEALQVSAQAAGYTDYITASFAFYFTFQGWPDNQPVELSYPSLIPFSSRCFLITITSVNAHISEQGVKYSVEAVPTNQLGFANASNLLSDVKVEGGSVQEVLVHLFDGINQTIIANAISATKQTKSAADVFHDTYELSIPDLVPIGGTQDIINSLLYSKDTGENKNFTSANKELLNSKVNPVLNSNSIYKMGDPSKFKDGYAAVNASSTVIDTTDKISLSTAVAIFPANSKIHDCIMAVIRDSEYVSTHIYDNPKVGYIKDDMFTYFSIRIEVSYGKFDPTRNKFCMNYRYIVEPYTMHVSRIPGKETALYDMNPIKTSLQRSYDYIYTGKNLDVLKFDLKFDNLYFSAMAVAAGKNRAEIPGSITANPADLTDFKYPNSAFGRDPAQAAQYKQPVPVTPRVIDNLISNTPELTASQPQTTAYQRLSYLLNRSILEGADKIIGDLEIFGDPYYLTTGGTLTRNLELADAYINTAGEAEVTQGAVYINLNFRNPIDLGTDGFMKFSKNASFSGIYQVTTVKSTFKNGMFTQLLHVIRLPGQAESHQSTVAAADLITSPYPETASVRSSRSAAITDNGPPDPDAYDKILLSKLQAEDSTIAKTNISIPVPLIPDQASFNENILSSLNSISNPGLQVNSLGALLPNQVSLPSVSFSNPLDQVSALQNQLTSAVAKFTNIDLTAINDLASQGIDLSAITPAPGSSEVFSDLLNKIPTPQPLSIAPIPLPDPRTLLEAATKSVGNLPSVSSLASSIPTVSGLSIPDLSNAIPTLPSVSSLASSIPTINNVKNNPIVNFISKT